MEDLLYEFTEFCYSTTGVIIFNLIVLIKAFIMGFVTSWIAEEKERKHARWFWIGFVFGSIALLILFLTSKDTNIEENEIWICEECETQNTGDKCKKCGTQKSKLIV